MSGPLLQVRGLSVAIGGLSVVCGLDLYPGERLALLGRNGAGKTTLLHTLAGLRSPQAGELLLQGRSYADQGPRAAARLRGLLPQHQGDAFPATVLETVLAGRHPHLSRWAWESEADERLAREALEQAGLGGCAERPVHTLSGGERQRAAIATLLVQSPALYLLDEPLAHLDLNHQIATLDLFSRRAREQDAALVMVLHDVNLAARHGDRFLLLHDRGGHELRSAPLDAACLSRLYGHPLHAVNAGGRAWFLPELDAPLNPGGGPGRFPGDDTPVPPLPGCGG